MVKHHLPFWHCRLFCQSFLKLRLGMVRKKRRKIATLADLKQNTWEQFQRTHPDSKTTRGKTPNPKSALRNLLLINRSQDNLSRKVTVLFNHLIHKYR